MTVTELKHEANMEKWRENIQLCRSSGVSVTKWCEKYGVSTNTYYRWERELFGRVAKEAALPARTASFTEISVPVPQRSSSGAVIASIHLGSAVVDIYSGADPHEVKALCEALSLC